VGGAKRVVAMGKHRDETDEEKRARRLAKKATKRERESESLAGYSNDANPWNDPNLGEAFVWGKKEDRDKKMHGEPVVEHDSHKRRRAEQLKELEKVKKSREDREREREEWEAEKLLLEREREQMAFVENEKREEEFQLKQTHLRAHIRVGEGRAKPIDVLSESLQLLIPAVDAEQAAELARVRVQNPFLVFDGATQRELRDLHGELCRRAQLDVENGAFWSAMRRLCEAMEEGKAGNGASGGAGSLNKAVSDEVAQVRAAWPASSPAPSQMPSPSPSPSPLPQTIIT
jgi:hypothetical protein